MQVRLEDRDARAMFPAVYRHTCRLHERCLRQRTRTFYFAPALPEPVLKLPAGRLSRKKVNARATDSNACDVQTLELANPAPHHKSGPAPTKPRWKPSTWLVAQTSALTALRVRTFVTTLKSGCLV